MFPRPADHAHSGGSALPKRAGKSVITSDSITSMRTKPVIGHFDAALSRSVITSSPTRQRIVLLGIAAEIGERQRSDRRPPLGKLEWCLLVTRCIGVRRLDPRFSAKRHGRLGRVLHIVFAEIGLERTFGSGSNLIIAPHSGFSVSDPEADIVAAASIVHPMRPRPLRLTFRIPYGDLEPQRTASPAVSELSGRLSGGFGLHLLHTSEPDRTP